MEFPYSHHSHSHHPPRNAEEEEEARERERPHYPPPPAYYQENEYAPPPPRPPPPYYPEAEFGPPPTRPPPRYYEDSEYRPPPPAPQVTHEYHASEQQQPDSLNYPPPPATAHACGTGASVQHLSHEVDQESFEKTETHHTFKPHLPSFLHHQSHQTSSGSGLDLSTKPTYRVFCKAAPNFLLTIRDGKVILAPSDQSDEFQRWYKDEKYSTRVKDEEGFPCFALVNKTSGQAMKHSIGASHPVQLIPYNPDVLDESILWTEGKDLGDGFRAVRMVNNVRLNLDAFHGDKKSGGVHDGTTVVLWQWNKGDNQRWQITPHCKFTRNYDQRN